MAHHGAPSSALTPADPQNPEDSLRSLRTVILAASWHATVMDGLIAGAQRAMSDAAIEADVVRVPGSFELPVAAAALAERYDAVVALGVVIRGGTPHFDYVCQAATEGLTRVSTDARTPVGFGLLTCDDDAQALDRAGLADRGDGSPSREDKGYEATAAALQTAALLRSIRRG
ncbi:MAG TPA: 6,7-dimethyl-8-ribityllumazine synthase [Brevibacterium sp.]|nr:6,7-dimethyl-8-ribityllumazine synthase [Brevibacterium sp.]